jgi:hypothetical protein
MRKRILIAAITATMATTAYAGQIPNKNVAEALQSLIDAERATYNKLVVDREDDHGCQIAESVAALKKDKGSVPNVDDFQKIVAISVAAFEEGKYADGLDTKALAATAGSMKAKDAADLLHAYADISRTSYTKSVIARAKESGCGTPTEYYMEEDGLALPAQFTRATATAVQKAGKFSYTLKSQWPINTQNTPRTEFEVKAIKAIESKKPYYGTEDLGGIRYYSAAYADVATVAVCASCHNNHEDSPKTDFQLNDVMGGMVVRFPAK